MNTSKQIYQDTLSQIEAEGLYKKERTITTPQSVGIRTQEGGDVLNFCANNYLGLADNPDIIAAAKGALDDHGFGMASVRFICGTQDLHKNLESKISDFFGTDDTILYTSCFDANGGLFETLLCKNILLQHTTLKMKDGFHRNYINPYHIEHLLYISTQPPQERRMPHCRLP